MNIKEPESNENWSKSGAYYLRKALRRISFCVRSGRCQLSYYRWFRLVGMKHSKQDAATLQALYDEWARKAVSSRVSKLLVQLPGGGSLHFTTDVPPQYIECLLGHLFVFYGHSRSLIKILH